jgi:hypothetical protein
MGTLFMLLFGMLVGGAGIALGIVAYDRSLERRLRPQRISKSAR